MPNDSDGNCEAFDPRVCSERHRLLDDGPAGLSLSLRLCALRCVCVCVCVRARSVLLVVLLLLNWCTAPPCVSRSQLWRALPSGAPRLSPGMRVYSGFICQKKIYILNVNCEPKLICLLFVFSPEDL